MILLTGATGKTGSAAANALIAQGVPPRALVRNEQKAAFLKEAGVELVIGDIGDARSLDRALAGVERAVLIFPNSDRQLGQEKTFVDRAEKAGVRHIVKLSSMEAVPDAAGPVPRIHVESESYIEASGLAWTFVKPNFFLQNLLGSAATIRAQHKLFLPMAEGRTGMSDVRDVGAVIAEAVKGQGHEGRSYEITGPELLSFGDVAERFSRVLGTPIGYVDVPLDSHMRTIRPYLLNDWHVKAVADLFGEIAAGGLDHLTTDAEEVLNRKPISLARFIEDHRAAFAPARPAGARARRARY